jgi:hypothetical protein
MTRSPAEAPASGADNGPRKAFIVGLAAGLPVMGWGVYGLFVDGSRTHPGLWIRWFAGGGLVHDLLVAPAVLLVGAVVARYVPGRFRAPVQAALIPSAVITLVATPFVAGWGRIPSNPSALLHDYVRNLVIVLAGIWSACLGYAVVISRRKHTAQPRRPKLATSSDRRKELDDAREE